MVAHSVQTVLDQALSLNPDPDPDIPYFSSRKDLGGGQIKLTKELFVGSAVLSTILKRPGLGDKYEAIAFMKHRRVEEDDYLDILDKVINKANAHLAGHNGLPIPSFRDFQFSLQRLQF